MIVSGLSFGSFDFHWFANREVCAGLGSVVVFMTTLFALGTGVSSGYAALVILQAEIFAEASRQLVRWASESNYFPSCC